MVCTCIEAKHLCFNSKLVRLKDVMGCSIVQDRPKFQFQTGSIKSHGECVVCFRLRGFNSKLVRLKVTVPSSPLWGLLSFNSKLVRLKAEWENALKRLGFQFQFQTGSIKRDPLRHGRVYRFFLMFQFQTGSIKRFRQMCQASQKGSVSIPNWFD